jgi:hypothetical protein
MICKCIVALLLLSLSAIQSKPVETPRAKESLPKIIRQTRGEYFKVISEIMSHPDSVGQYPARRAPEDTSVFGKPITALLPLDKIESIFVPHPSTAINRGGGAPADDRILELLTRGRLTSLEEMHNFHLAPWMTLTLTMDDKKRIRVDMMLGGSMGFVVFPDGQTYGYIRSSS